LNGRAWSDDDVAILRRDYPDTDTEALSATLGRPAYCVKRKARLLGIRKSAASLARTRFKVGELCGQDNPKWKPVGSECVTADGYRWRKISETGKKNTDWRPVHLIVWEQHYGNVPAGLIVAFRDGNKENIAIDNLVLLSRRGNLSRNTIHRYPKPLKRLIKLTRRLARAITDKSEAMS